MVIKWELSVCFSGQPSFWGSTRLLDNSGPPLYYRKEITTKLVWLSEFPHTNPAGQSGWLSIHIVIQAVQPSLYDYNI